MDTPDKQSPVVLLGVGGGVAAYKAVTVASRLRQAGWEVHVVMTRAATAFVTPLTFSAITGRRAVVDGHEPSTDAREDLFPHLFPATVADVCCIVPATANLLGKIAHGIGDDALTTAALSLPAHCRRYVCPSMNVEMWQQPVVQQNAAAARTLGWQQLGPADGHQACGAVGPGRMWESEAIVERLLADQAMTDELAGRTVLVVSGPTMEAIDPVRYISNRSSGKMGRAVAERVAAAGARVLFVTGPVRDEILPRHPGITIEPVTSAADMLAAAQAHFAEADAVIYVAAVADYTPAQPSDRKMEKSTDALTIELKPTADIAASLGAIKRPGQVCVGFALETHDGPARARGKLARKNFDAIVLNGVDSFGAATGHFTMITADEEYRWGLIGKTDCANRIVTEVASRLNAAAK